MSTYLEPGWIDRFAELWESLGPETRTAILALLGDDWTFEGKRVMDFGCGAGRTLRHFTDEARVAELWGVDIDGPSIELLRETVCPPLHVMQSQYLPPLAPTQHGCPAPPHATHARPAHSVYAPVQPTPPPQQACPSLPQVPPLQPPVLQAPCPPEHRPPLATHWFAFASQQPPPEHHPLSQHG